MVYGNDIGKFARSFRQGAYSLAAIIGALGVISSAHASLIDTPFFLADGIVIVIGGSDFADQDGDGPVVVDFGLLSQTQSGQAFADINPTIGVTTNANSTGINPVFSDEAGGLEIDIVDPAFGGDFISGAPGQILDENDRFTEFGLNDDTDIAIANNGARASRFFVASNTPFDIYAHAENLEATGDFSDLSYDAIRFRFRVQTRGGANRFGTRWGDNAQNPATDGEGVLLGLSTNGQNIGLDVIEAGPTKIFDGGRKTAANQGSILSQAVSFQARYNLRGANGILGGYDFSQGTGLLSAEVTYTLYAP